MIDGITAPEFEHLRETFAENFADGLETGAAFAACRGDQVLVDLWGGDAAPGRAWSGDSLQLIYSGSKGLTAICLWMLIDRGQLDLDEPVNRYWPAFGKPDIKVGHILSHTSRLPGITETTTWEDMLDHQVMADKLARQAPYEDPRCLGITYHPLTYGWLCGELLRQVDGRSLGTFFAEEIASALDLEVWFGLPEQYEARVTTLGGDGVWGNVSKNLRVPTPVQAGADPVHATIWYNPPLFGPDFSKWNSRACHAAEIPGGGAIGTARSIARLYAEVASGGGRLVRPETLRLCTAELADSWDGVNDERRRYAAGVSLQIETMQFGPPADAFGHGGAGGSVHGAWPSHGIGFSYAMNRLIDGVDPRATRLLAALHECVERTIR